MHVICPSSGSVPRMPSWRIATTTDPIFNSMGRGGALRARHSVSCGRRALSDRQRGNKCHVTCGRPATFAIDSVSYFSYKAEVSRLFRLVLYSGPFACHLTRFIIWAPFTLVQSVVKVSEVWRRIELRAREYLSMWRTT